MNLVISTCGAIGVGYVVYKQSIRPGFSEMGSRGGSDILPGDGNLQQKQNQLEQTQ